LTPYFMTREQPGTMLVPLARPRYSTDGPIKYLGITHRVYDVREDKQRRYHDADVRVSFLYLKSPLVLRTIAFDALCVTAPVISSSQGLPTHVSDFSG